MAVDRGPVDVTRRLEIRTVVIDPGHGGADPGVAGAGGLLEKDVNLEVALASGRCCAGAASRWCSPVRTTDHLNLAERAEIANAAGGDLFISLHCNGWFNEGARGIETYFLSPQERLVQERGGGGEPGHGDRTTSSSSSGTWCRIASSRLERPGRGGSGRGDAAAGPARSWRAPGRLPRAGGGMDAGGAGRARLLTHPDEARRLPRRLPATLASAIGEAVAVYRRSPGARQAVAREASE